VCVGVSDVGVVIDLRVGNLIPQQRLTNSGGLLFRDIFAVVNSDHDDVVWKLPLDLPQLRKNVDAVYSAIRPETQKNHLPADAFQRKGFATRMNPVETLREFGRGDAGQIQIMGAT
jgi:hypothetical protein